MEIDTSPLDMTKYARELLIYYKSMGWDGDGVPTAQTIDELNLRELTN